MQMEKRFIVSHFSCRLWTLDEQIEVRWRKTSSHTLCRSDEVMTKNNLFNVNSDSVEYVSLLHINALLGLWLRPETLNRCAHFATRSMTILSSRRIWVRCGNVSNWNNWSRWLTGRSQFSINGYCLKWMEPFIQFLLLLSITSSNDE